MLGIKIILLVYASVSFVCAADRPKVIFAPEVLQVIRAAMVKCIAESGVDPNVIIKIEEGGYYTDEAFKKFVHCTFNKSGFSNSDGSVKIDEAISIFPKDSSSNVADVIKKCNIVKDDPVETTYGYYTCFQDNSPVIMAICYENNDMNKNVCK